MNKLEKLENITITYSKCLVLFLMCFIPFRNELELLLGTYIKVLPDMMILILLMGYVISQRGRVKIQLSDIIFCLFFLVALINTIFIKKHVGYKFNGDYTISYYLGKNEHFGTLSDFGEYFVLFLDMLDKNHCKKAYKAQEGKI